MAREISPSASASVRIDADTRAKLAELQQRLLTQSGRAADLELRRGGIPLGMVVEKALGVLERELNASTTQENEHREVIARQSAESSGTT